MVRFCPRCGGILRPMKEKGKTILVCSRCGYKEESSPSNAFRFSSKIEHSEKEKTIVLDNDIDVTKLPITKEVTCRKCGAHEAYYWMIQTRAADEPPTRFYKCVRCGYVWREYE